MLDSSDIELSDISFEAAPSNYKITELHSKKKTSLTCNPPPPDQRKVDRMAKSSASSPRGHVYTSSIPKVNENVPSNHQYAPNMMDPVNKPKMPPNTDIQNTWMTAMPENMETNYARNTNAMHNNFVHVQGSGNNSRSDSLESCTTPLRPHIGGDGRWDAINTVSVKGAIGLNNFRLLKRLGYGDIGSVYLVELRGTKAHFAMKVMDKTSLASRNKLLRAQTEREILDKFYCLVMEFCSGGNLHSLRQKQPNKHFTEEAARFFASEVLLALEYLHMLGIVYRDLKPENVLVRDEGHIMLSDFDLSLLCFVSPTLVKSSSTYQASNGGGTSGILDTEHAALQGCMQPSTFFPRILPSKKTRKSKSDFGLFVDGAMPELMAEPTNVRSMSFVGTHEYLAPKIIRGEGHGSAVDWWTFGIFLYELLHGTTPFKGQGNRATLSNVVEQPLRFPESPQVSFVARDLIRGLLVKEPHKRIACKRGATEIKQHPFFEGVNWALVRSAVAPHIPELIDFSLFATNEDKKKNPPHHLGVGGDKNIVTTSTNYIEFEYF
ncbi:hypothetical protein CRYUN_Cryun33cG0001900 [Craigia yunnanensis]